MTNSVTYHPKKVHMPCVNPSHRNWGQYSIYLLRNDGRMS